MNHATASAALLWLRRRWPLLLGALAALLVVALIVLAAFPWGMLQQTVTQRLSDATGRQVTIASFERRDAFSLHPVVEIRGLEIPQPEWAETNDPVLKIAQARVRFAALPLLLGDFRLEELDISGASALLIRTADKQTNWSSDEKDDSGNDSPFRHALRSLRVSDTRIRYRDALQKRAFDLSLRAEAERGLTVEGSGTVHGNPVQVTARGGSFSGDGEPRWPFEVDVSGDAVALHAEGSMARPLAFDAFQAHITARGASLSLVDALIEAGLPETQPVKLEADVTRADNRWRITELTGTVGRSDLSGEAELTKSNGRTRIDGSLRSRRFDFDDLASDAQRAAAAAKTARIGQRVVPDTAIDLSNLGNTDGELRVRADRLLWPGSKPFRSLRATVTLESKRLTVSQLVFGLPHGSLAGEARVVQEEGGPRLSMRLTLEDARLADLFPDAGIDAPARGRLDLSGTGVTLREAVGNASGSFALTARDGTIPDRTALLLGQDVGGGLFASKKRQARLRCIAARFAMEGGTATAQDVRIDTSRALTRARGRITFPGEQLALALNGVPKEHATLRVEGPVPVRGTIKSPDVGTPESADSVGDILGQLGEAIFGGDDAVSQDIDCEAAIARALDF